MASSYQLSLLITELCNLKCTYCYSDKRRRKVMDLCTAKESIDKAIDRLDDNTQLNILLMGGEPFMAFDLIKDIVSYIRSCYKDKGVFIKTVTNGTLVHGEIQDWLAKNRDCFFASLSVDGLKENHDKNRCNSYDKIDFDFFTRLYKENAEASMVACPDNLGSLYENVIHVEQLGFRVKCVLADDCYWELNRDKDLLIEQLSLLIDYYTQNPDKYPFSMLRESLQHVGKKNLDKCKPWENSHCVDPDGHLWGCHRCAPLYNKGIWAIPDERISLGELTLRNDCHHCPALTICCACPALVASLFNKPEIAETMCELFRVIHVANAVFLSKLFLECPNHIYLKNRSNQEKQEIITAIQMITEKMKI